MSLINKRIVDPVLTNIARGYSNLSYIGTKLFPEVDVEKEGGKIPQFSKEAFKIYNTERAIRSKSNRIMPEGLTSVDFTLTEHDIEYPLDYREVEESPLPLKLHATHVTTEAILLRLENIIATLVQDTNSFGSNNKVTLGAGDKFTNANSDPVAIFETAREAVRTQIAKRPNVCVLGAVSYKALKSHPAIVDKIKYTSHAVVTPELLRELLGFDELYVGDAVKSNDAGTFSDVWSDNCIVAYVPRLAPDTPRTFYEPAFGYTLGKSGYPLVDTYVEEGGKVFVVRNTDILTAKIVGAEAGYLINDTNA